MLGGGGEKEEETSLGRLVNPPIAAPLRALVTVTMAASTGKDCLASQVLKRVSHSLYLVSTCLSGFW